MTEETYVDADTNDSELHKLSRHQFERHIWLLGFSYSIEGLIHGPSRTLEAIDKVMQTLFDSDASAFIRLIVQLLDLGDLGVHTDRRQTVPKCCVKQGCLKAMVSWFQAGGRVKVELL